MDSIHVLRQVPSQHTAPRRNYPTGRAVRLTLGSASHMRLKLNLEAIGRVVADLSR